MPVSPGLKDLLNTEGLMRGEVQVDRRGLGRRSVMRMMPMPNRVIDYEPADRQRKAKSAAEIVLQEFGRINDAAVRLELTDLVTSVLGAEGHGQRVLEELHELEQAQSENGAEPKPVLLSDMVERVISNGEGTGTPTKVRGYFITTNPDLIEELMWDKSGDRVVSGLRTTNRRIAFTTKRVPELESHKAGFYGELESRIQHELPAPPPPAQIGGEQ